MNRDASVLKPYWPIISAWTASIQYFLPYCGRLLVAWELDVARKAGVRHPEKIKVVMVNELPFPEHPELRSLSMQYGLGGSDMVGLTVGYGVFILQGHYSKRLLSHECRHVFQYEEAGSVGEFMSRYLGEILEYGYMNSPLEQDARSHEVTNVLTRSL